MSREVQGAERSSRRKGAQDGLARAFRSEQDAAAQLAAILGAPPTKAVNHQEAMAAGIAAAISALLGAKPDSLNRALGLYLGTKHQMVDQLDARARLAAEAQLAGAHRAAQDALMMTNLTMDQLNREDQRAFASEQDRERRAFERQQADRQISSREKIAAEDRTSADRRSGLTLGAKAEADRQLAARRELDTIARTVSGLLGSISRARPEILPDILGSYNQWMGELSRRLGVEVPEVRPLQVSPLMTGSIGSKKRGK